MHATGLALAFITISTVASAYSGSPAEQRACRHDVSRFCRAVMHDSEDRVSQCLSLNAAHISQACQQVLRAHGQL
jgi:hypothetical protein